VVFPKQGRDARLDGGAMVMRLSDSSTGVYVPALHPVGRIAITIAVFCAVMALSMNFLASTTPVR
jgi:hypothetical protein